MKRKYYYSIMLVLFHSPFAFAFGAKPPQTVQPPPSATPSPTSAPPASSGSGQATPPSPKSSQQLRGLDVYHGDDVTSWSQVIGGGSSFVMVKATEGLSFEDPAYSANRAQAKAVGLVFGAYHLIHLDEDPVEQADYFANFINAHGGLESGDFVVLDWETVSGSPYSSNDAQTIQAFLNEIKVKISRRCVVYVDSSMPNEVGNPGFLKEYPLWLADPNPSPRVPAPWSSWSFRQDNDNAKIPGLRNLGDSDLFQGDLADLTELYRYTILE